MGILSKIGKVASWALPMAAAIPTGGASMAAVGGGGILAKILGIGSKVAPVLGGMANRGATANQADRTNAAVTDRTALDRFKTNQELPTNRLNTGIKADRISRAQPVRIGWGGPGSGMKGNRTTGGYSEDLVSADTRRMADDISHKTMLDQLGGVQAPGPTETSTSAADKVVGGAATATSLMAPFADLLMKRQRPQPVVPPTPEMDLDIWKQQQETEPY